MTTGERAAWVQAWASIVTVALTLCGLLFVVYQIDFAKEQYLSYKAERNTERMERFYEEWSSPTMLAYRANAANNHPNDSAYLVEVFSFFERLALAKKKGIVSIDDMDDYFQTAMLGYWCGFEGFVKKNRADSGGDNTLWSEFEASVKELQTVKHARCLSGPELQMFMAVEKDRYLTLREINAPPTQSAEKQ